MPFAKPNINRLSSFVPGEAVQSVRLRSAHCGAADLQRSLALMRWTQLQKQVHNLLDPELKMRIHCTGYPLSGSASIGRCWITLDGEIIWDVPKDFPDERRKGTYNDVASRITSVLKDYLATPKSELIRTHFPGDHWGLVHILLAADRRIGKKSLESLSKKELSVPAQKVLLAR